MSCRIKDLSITALEKKGAIAEKSGEILDFSLFEKVNRELTEVAYTKYNVGDGKTEMFDTDNDEQGRLIIEPNDVLLEFLDEAIETFKQDSDNIRKAALREMKEDLNTLESLRDDDAEPLFVLDELNLEEQAKEKSQKNVVPEFKNLEDEVAYNVRKMLDNLDIAVKRTRSNKGKSKSAQKYQEELEALVAEMKALDEAQNWHSILLYVNKLEEVVNAVITRMEKVDVDDNSIFTEIARAEDYLATFDLVEDVKKLLSDTKFSKSVANKEDVKAVREKINDFANKYEELRNDFSSIKKRKLVELLADDRFATEIETKWRNRFQAEARKLKIRDKTSWIAKKLIEHKDEIDNDRKEFANKVVTGITPDMSAYAAGLFDPLNTNGKLFNLLVNIVADVRDKIITRVRKFDMVLDDLHKDIVKDLGSSIPSTAYKNVLRQSSSGKYYVRGDWKIEFIDEFNNVYVPLRDQYMEIRDGYLENGYTITQIKKKPDYQKIAKKFYAWRNENLTDIGQGMHLPNLKWQDNLADLTPTERKIAATYRDTINKTSIMMERKASLKQEIYHAGFYSLPAVSKSETERFLELDGKGYLADKAADLTRIRVDDFGYQAQAVASKGTEMKQLKIHYRGKMEPENQSLDLLTLMRMEVNNGVSYHEKKQAENLVNVIKDVSREKKYIQDSSKGGYLYNLFRKREPLETKQAESNEFKRISGYIESSFYDELHKHAPQMLGMDVNKMVSVVNGTTAFIGMSANVASGLANITNGFTQLFIESVGGNHLSFKSLMKAEKAYGRDLPNILADLGNPVKKSKTNQILQMFDVFGGQSVTNQDFIKDNMFKNLAEARTLSGLQETGEHMMQAIISMAILDTLKVMDSNGNYINKEGKVVEEKEAASLLDMLEFDDKGVLKMNEKVSLTNQNMVTDFHKGGKAHINIFIKKKIHDTMGAYDPNYQNELYRVWYGKLLMMFKRFLIPGLQARWKGISTAHKDRDNLDDSELIYNTALKQYEEGTYTTFARTVNAGKFMGNLFRGQFIPALEALKWAHLKENYDKMSDYERANLRKATTELLITAVILPTMGYMVTMRLEEDEDNEYLWFLAYQLRRLTSELKQYRALDEAWRITTNPIAGTRIIQNGLDLISRVVNPFSWDDENSRGENKLLNSALKVTPVWVQLSKEWKQSYNFINNQAN